jgi:hypothetical protein
MIEDLYLPSKGERTPVIDFKTNGVFEMSGKSYPHDSIEYYRPIINWLKEYSKEPDRLTTFNVNLEYLNTGSSKIMSDILKILKDLHVSKKSKVIINWQYDEDDEEMCKTGQLYKDIFTVPFNLIEII